MTRAPRRTAPARQPHRLPRPHDRRQPNQLRPRRRLPTRQRRPANPAPRPHATKPGTEPTPTLPPPPDPAETDFPAPNPPTPTTPTDIHDRLIPSPQPPHRNNRNNTTRTAHRTPPQRRTDTAQPRRPPPAFATSANLGGPHGIRGELIDRRVFRVTLEADWRPVGIPLGAAPRQHAGDRGFRRPANPQGAPAPYLSKLPYRDRSGFAPWRIMRRAADTRWHIPEVWLGLDRWHSRTLPIAFGA